MRMIKFWMVLSSIVFGMVIPVYEGYAQEAPDPTQEAATNAEGTIKEATEEQKKAVVAEEADTKEDESDKAAEIQTDREEAQRAVIQEEEAVLPEQESAKISPEERTADKVQEGEEVAEAVVEETTAEPVEQVAVEAPAEKEEGGKAVSEPVHDIKVDTDSEEVQLDEDEEDKAIESMDTINLKDPQGNWLIKRFWFNKAEQLYEQMSERIQRIFDFGVEFQEKSAKLDQKLFDPFYLDIGIGRGELTELVDSLIEQLVQDDTDLSAERDQQEAEHLRQLEEEKGTIEQLKADIEGVSDIDTAVNNALATFNERANLSRNYHSKAWNLLQEIAHELNDKKARELYFTIKSLARSIVDIEEYITSPFLEYFDELSNKADEQINRIKQEVAVLKQRGIDLKKKVDDLEYAQQKKQLEEAEHQGRSAAELEQQKREEKEQGFFSSIGNMVQYMWNTFYAFLQKLFGPAKTVDAQEGDVQEEEKQETDEQALDGASVEVEEAIELQEKEMPEEEPVAEVKEAEVELASDAEQQEVMTAGAEEVELVKKKEESGISEAGTGVTEEELEVRPAIPTQESTVSPIETESNQEQAQ